jgi:hypothetical protein
MSDAIAASLNLASQYVAIYLNLLNLILGISGGILNMVVFLSLKTFRDNTCAFYLTVMSFFNIGQLISGSLSRFVISGYDIDWTITSLFYCKFRVYLVQICGLVSFTCLCLATIDQYFATCKHVQWQRWSNIKFVRYITIIVIIFWMIFSILYLVFYEIIISSTTGKLTCMSRNAMFDRYNTYFHRIVILGFLPNFISGLFGGLARRNISQLAYRAVPIVRRQLDKQLTKMLLVQVVFNIFALSLFNIVSVIVPSIVTINDSVLMAKLQFVQVLSSCIYFMYAAVSMNC